MEEESKTKFSMNVEFSFAFKKKIVFIVFFLVQNLQIRYNKSM